MIYTIGYSDRSLENFLAEIERRKIHELWDVRSSPRSRNAPFNATNVVQWSAAAKLSYRQMGHVLGGREKRKLEMPSYAEALEELISASKRAPVVVMCAEGDAAHCHRTYEIGATLLLRYGTAVRSILRYGHDEDITETLKRVRRRDLDPEWLAALNPQAELFAGRKCDG